MVLPLQLHTNLVLQKQKFLKCLGMSKRAAVAKTFFKSKNNSSGSNIYDLEIIEAVENIASITSSDEVVVVVVVSLICYN